MKTNINKRIAYVVLFATLILSAFFFVNSAHFYADGAEHDSSLSVGEEEIPPVQESAPSVLSIDKAASPIAGRTSWADKDKGRPLGFVIYLNDVSFTENQINLQMRITQENLAKITFTRGEKSATPVLICASKDGGYSSKSFFAFFFGGALYDEALNEYIEGDKVAIEEGCVLKCNEGKYFFGSAVEYTYDGKQWTTTKETAPEIIEYSAVGVPVDGVTNWGKDKGYVGIVIYNEGLSFEGGQSHLEIEPWTKTEKITFSRGAATEECALIVAGKDGTKNTCYCSYFFGGELAGTSLKSGDTVKIKGDFAFTTKEGRYSYGADLEFIYDGTQWTVTDASEPEIIEYSGIGVPVDGVTNWGKNKGYVGIVIYNDGLSFEGVQAHLQTKPWTRTEKVTFIRGTITEECILIVAGLDGNKSICYCSYFFGGELAQTALQSGDTVRIKGDFAFTTKEGRYSYGADLEFIYDGTQWVDRAVGDETLTYITYITEPIDDGNNIIFNLKTTTIFSVDDAVTDELKQSILINGISVKDLIDDSKANINYSISKIVLSVNKGALRLNDFDMISIKKDALLKSNGLKLRDDETFRYSYTLKRTDFIPDYDYYGKLSTMAIIDIIEIAGDTSPIEINGVKYELAHSVWIHFKWASKFNYDTFQMHLSAEQFVSTGVLNEKLCYEYQKLGFFYSITDLLHVNGKSIYEWMIEDAKNGTANCFKIEYLPYEIDSGRVLRIVVADESSLDIGIGVDQSIEFKNGFINPGLGEINRDSIYSIKAEDATMNNKFSMGFKQENKGIEEKSSGCSCSGEISIEYSSLFFLASALLLSIFVLLKKRGRKGEK